MSQKTYELTRPFQNNSLRLCFVRLRQYILFSVKTESQNFWQNGSAAALSRTSPGTRHCELGLLDSEELPFQQATYLQFRFEAFNFLNHPIWGDPDTNLPDGTFGQISYTRHDMRELQFSLKLVF